MKTARYVSPQIEVFEVETGNCMLQVSDQYDYADFAGTWDDWIPK